MSCCWAVCCLLLLMLVCACSCVWICSGKGGAQAVGAVRGGRGGPGRLVCCALVVEVVRHMVLVV